MNTGRLFITLVTVLGLAISAGCSKPEADSPKQQAPPVTTDMEIVVPDTDPSSAEGGS